MPRGVHRLKDISGQRFGRLVAQCIAGRTNKKVDWHCVCDCGNTAVVGGGQLRSGRTNSCGCLRDEVNRFRMTGSRNPAFKRGWYLTKEGYVMLTHGYAHEKYPDAVFSGRVVLEHVAAMSHHLKRALYPGETVHHKNGVRSDNHFDNLELRASSHGKGQTIEDLRAWARDILRRYPDYRTP